MVRFLLMLSVLTAPLLAQPAGPDKTDIPYIVHGDALTELEVLPSKMEETKKDQRYWVAGTTSKARTPLASPDFLFKPSQIDPGVIRLYGFEIANGRRELLFRRKKKIVAQPYFLIVEPAGEGVVRIKVSGSLTPGEYGLTPDGSDDVFCFSVF